MNNLIKSAAEDYYQKTGVSNYDYGALVTHFVTYLAAQGDAAIARSIIEASISTWYNQDDAEELLCKALAIGRAMNSWIPVSERLPEEKQGKFAEWASGEGWQWVDNYVGKHWVKGFDGDMQTRTTPELWAEWDRSNPDTRTNSTPK